MRLGSKVSGFSYREEGGGGLFMFCYEASKLFRIRGSGSVCDFVFEGVGASFGGSVVRIRVRENSCGNCVFCDLFLCLSFLFSISFCLLLFLLFRFLPVYCYFSSRLLLFWFLCFSPLSITSFCVSVLI